MSASYSWLKIFPIFHFSGPFSLQTTFGVTDSSCHFSQWLLGKRNTQSKKAHSGDTYDPPGSSLEKVNENFNY